MTLAEIFSNLGAGGVVSILVILLSLVEITPVKFSPLKWIGQRVNVGLSEDVKDLTHRVDAIDEKLNNHMVESYRTNILEFADSIIGTRKKKYPHDKWRQMLKVCAAYEHMIESEHLINGDATEAINYIRAEYQRVVQSGSFQDFPKEK